jgi:protein SCO1
MNSLGAPIPTGAFSLVDHDGRRVDENTYRGFYRLVYFGFTHCKVVCPRNLAKLSSALKAIGERADLIRPLYITVDPQRDTADAMRLFLRDYPRFTGLTGSPEEIEQAKRSFRVFAGKVSDRETDYAVPHSSITYLMDRDGSYLEHFLDSMPAERLAQRLRELIPPAPG